jgi:hypothetical protein
MYVPEFPYTGNQAIIKSDRIILMGDKDAVFIFGNQAIGLSSRHTINLDAKEKVTISSPKIELGNNAKSLGEPVILGDVLVSQLVLLLEKLTTFCEVAKKTSYVDINTIQDPQRVGQSIQEEIYYAIINRNNSSSQLLKNNR